MDTVTLERIKTLHPNIRAKVLSAYNHANNRLLGKGVRLRFARTYATKEEQDAIYAQGRTRLFDSNGKRLGIVSYVKGGFSIHNYGLAWDIVLLLDKDNNDTFETASWNSALDFDKDGTADWMEVVDYFKSLGFVWGGDWKNFKDKPHFETTFGHNARSLKKLVDDGKFTEEIINGKKYVYPII